MKFIVLLYSREQCTQHLQPFGESIPGNFDDVLLHPVQDGRSHKFFHALWGQGIRGEMAEHSSPFWSNNTGQVVLSNQVTNDMVTIMKEAGAHVVCHTTASVQPTSNVVWSKSKPITNKMKTSLIKTMFVKMTISSVLDFRHGQPPHPISDPSVAHIHPTRWDRELRICHRHDQSVQASKSCK